MKKILILVVLFCTFSPVFSMELDLTREGKQQKYINEIGFRILNANKIQKRINFYYKQNRSVNAYSKFDDRQVVVYSGIMPYLDSDDEMAAILSHEISHSVDSYEGLGEGAFMAWKYAFAPQKYETKADKRAVDYMVNAGYNPLAIVVAYNKIMPQNRSDWGMAHPLTSKRMAVVYEYIYRKYPAYLANNHYRDNIYYQNFLLTSYKNRQKLQKAIEKNSSKKVKYE